MSISRYEVIAVSKDSPMVAVRKIDYMGDEKVCSYEPVKGNNIAGMSFLVYDLQKESVKTWTIFDINTDKKNCTPAKQGQKRLILMDRKLKDMGCCMWPIATHFLRKHMQKKNIFLHMEFIHL